MKVILLLTGLQIVLLLGRYLGYFQFCGKLGFRSDMSGNSDKLL